MPSTPKAATTAAAAATTGSAAPLLSGNVPQQISYSGDNYIELRLTADAFIASAGTQGGQR